MKSEWELHFTTHGFRFDREHKYRAKINEKVSLGGREPELIEPIVRIIPSKNEPFPDSDQIGSLYILLPYSLQETKDFAYYLARLIAERISFSHGDFRLFGSLIVCKQIPETPEEEAEVGDSPYSVEMHLVEDLPPTVFDSHELQAAPTHSGMLPLIAQFNETKRITQPIFRFIGFFKIIESLTHARQESGRLKSVLLDSVELRRIYETIRADIDFDTFVERSTDVRHNCAHLKMDKEFGYTPLHSAVQSELQPLLPILEELSREAIKHWAHTDTQNDSSNLS